MAEARVRRSLVTRVLGAVLLILLLGGLLVAGSTWWNGRSAARQAYDRILLGAASDIAESIRIQNGAPLVDLPVSAFQLLAQAPDDRIHYVVHGPDGGFITGLDETTTIAAPARDGITPDYFDARMQGEPARFVRVTRLFAERDYSGAVEVMVGQTLRARRAMTRELMLDALWPMGLAGLVLLVMSWFVIRSALRPLEAISADLARRDPNDLVPIPTDRLPGELQVMLGAMNRFMGRLDRQVESMRNLISDTAHQLRTPVAAIRVQAEAALSEAGDQSQSAALDRLLARSRSLGRLLDQLLSRAMVIHRTDSAPRRPVDLREIALEIIERDEHQALAPGVEVRLDISDAPVIVLADAFSLGEAAKNLLANALRHGRPPITIGADQDKERAAIWVRDSGEGPAPDVAARMGDRFNRDRASGESGTGLGLSIVTSVASAFDGTVEMHRDDQGFRAALILPAAATEVGA
ncbi:sensor histidine kinase N-terminal domain-containing protein [Mameliella alba]|nr:sensor histidine kinase N-terminal domain-containing protein [Antarctobacter heliothermus]MBY6146491.1 sensor histidine kinase N-terminal domain-containing protein [Mameliella alba]MCA0956367.1 sensor histidine kinase N-terminal domain-containing protein [Mameliella alba]